MSLTSFNVDKQLHLHFLPHQVNCLAHSLMCRHISYQDRNFTKSETKLGRS